jgi:hypothetical protein
MIVLRYMNKPTSPTGDQRDLKRQECMYSIIQSPDGGFVVVGNNSRNFDDCYVAKLKNICTNASLFIRLPTPAGVRTLREERTGSIIVESIWLDSGTSCTFEAGVSVRLREGRVKPPITGTFVMRIKPEISCRGTYPRIQRTTPPIPDPRRLGEIADGTWDDGISSWHELIAAIPGGKNPAPVHRVFCL